MERIKDVKGITLVALVITIIVLLILAGITISLTIGKRGIVERAQEAGIEHIKAEIKQEIELAILEIETDLRSNPDNQSLDNNTIIENLPKKLDGILINSDMTGEYRDYEYWIDDEYKVHVEGKTNNPITVKLTAQKVGTASCEVVVEASSAQGNITTYQYKLNGQLIQETTQANCTIENLEPNTKYNISVMVIDEKGNKKSSMPISIITKERTYIIKDGIEQIQGAVGNATMTQKDGYLQIDSNTSSRSGYYFTYDLTKYKTIKIDTKVTSKGLEAGIALDMFANNADIFNGADVRRQNVAIGNETTKERAIYGLNCEDLTGEYKIFYAKNKSPAAKTSTNIYNLWLEE